MVHSFSDGQIESEASSPLACDAHYPAALVSTVESQIIPRLLMHSTSMRQEMRHAEARWHPGVEDVVEFAGLLIWHDAATAAAYLEAQLQQGTALPTLYVDLLAPTAGFLARMRRSRQLGRLRLMLARYRLLRVMLQLRRARSAEPADPAAAPH